MTDAYFLFTQNEWSDNGDYKLVSENQLAAEIKKFGSCNVKHVTLADDTMIAFTEQDDKDFQPEFLQVGQRFTAQIHKKWKRLRNGDWRQSFAHVRRDKRLYKIFLGEKWEAHLKRADPILSKEYDDFYELCIHCSIHLFNKIKSVLPDLQNSPAVDESFAPVDENGTICELCGKVLDPRT